MEVRPPPHSRDGVAQSAKCRFDHVLDNHAPSLYFLHLSTGSHSETKTIAHLDGPTASWTHLLVANDCFKGLIT